MSIVCNECNKGKLVFSDGAQEHNPIWECNNCGYQYDEEMFTDIYELNYDGRVKE